MDGPNADDCAPPVPGGHAVRYGALVQQRLNVLWAQLRADIPGAPEEAAQGGRRLLTPEPDGAGPSDVTALNNANRKHQRIRQGSELAAATRRVAEAVEASYRGHNIGWAMRPAEERGAVPPHVADQRAAALAAAPMRDRPPWVRHMRQGLNPPGGAAEAAVAMCPAQNRALEAMAAAVAGEVDLAQELEEEALLVDVAGRDPAAPLDIDLPHRGMQAPVPGGLWQQAFAAERLRVRPYNGGHNHPPPPQAVARLPPRPQLGPAADGAPAVADLNGIVLINCPICGVALPAHLSDDAVHAHLDQCFGQTRL